MFTMSSWPITQVLMLPSPPVLLVQGLGHGDRRPAVRGLPPQVGDGEQGGNGHAGRGPAVENEPRSPAEERTEEDCHGKETDAVLVRQAHPQDQAAQQPVAAIAGSSDAHHDQRECRPEHDVQGRGFQDVAGAEDGGIVAVATAASSWALRRPPSSRASNPAMITVAVTASADQRRRPGSQTPNSDSDTHASRGIRMGWSTYPPCRCRAESRKYSSSP